MVGVASELLSTRSPGLSGVTCRVRTSGRPQAKCRHDEQQHIKHASVCLPLSLFLCVFVPACLSNENPWPTRLEGHHRAAADFSCSCRSRSSSGIMTSAQMQDALQASFADRCTALLQQRAACSVRPHRCGLLGRQRQAGKGYLSPFRAQRTTVFLAPSWVVAIRSGVAKETPSACLSLVLSPAAGWGGSFRERGGGQVAKSVCPCVASVRTRRSCVGEGVRESIKSIEYLAFVC
jgi:hypothetical protein